MGSGIQAGRLAPRRVRTERRRRLLEQLRAGDALVDPVFTKTLISTFPRRRPAGAAPADPRLGSLTAREGDVLRLVAKGMNNARSRSAPVGLERPWPSRTLALPHAAPESLSYGSAKATSVPASLIVQPPLATLVELLLQTREHE